MVDQPARYEIDPGGKFKAAVREAAAMTDDLTIPFISITKSWYQGNKAIFTLKSPGKYEDYKLNKHGFSPYAKRKEQKLGSAYPMLRGFTRRLETSLTDPGAQDSINQIVNKKTLLLGTRAPSAVYTQLGTKYMVARPSLFIGGEQQAPGMLEQRRDAWTQILLDYVKQCTQKVGSMR